jgi:hypothetical protein
MNNNIFLLKYFSSWKRPEEDFKSKNHMIIRIITAFKIIKQLVPDDFKSYSQFQTFKYYAIRIN